jgi:hypothetical protein
MTNTDPRITFALESTMARDIVKAIEYLDRHAPREQLHQHPNIVATLRKRFAECLPFRRLRLCYREHTVASCALAANAGNVGLEESMRRLAVRVAKYDERESEIEFREVFLGLGVLPEDHSWENDLGREDYAVREMISHAGRY